MLSEVLQEVLPEDVDDLDFTVDSIFQDVDNIEVVDWNLYGARPRTRPRPSSVLSSPPRTRHRVREEAGPASRTRSQSSMQLVTFYTYCDVFMCFKLSDFYVFLIYIIQ